MASWARARGRQRACVRARARMLLARHWGARAGSAPEETRGLASEMRTQKGGETRDDGNK